MFGNQQTNTQKKKNCRKGKIKNKKLECCLLTLLVQKVTNCFLRNNEEEENCDGKDELFYSLFITQGIYEGEETEAITNITLKK
jgi:hypothetical protein